MLPFSFPAVAADGYVKRKVVESLAVLNQGSDGQKGGAEGGAPCVLGWVLFKSSQIEIVAKGLK